MMAITATITDIQRNPDSVSVTFTRSDTGEQMRVAADPGSSPEEITAAVKAEVAAMNAVSPSQDVQLIGTVIT